MYRRSVPLTQTAYAETKWRPTKYGNPISTKI